MRLDLKNRTYFPTAVDLPELRWDYDVTARFFVGKETPPGEVIRQDKKIHWCFIDERVPVPEAIAHIPNVMRNQLNIRHPNGEAIFFDFFVGSEHKWNSVLPSMTAHLKIGYTVAIMYAVHTVELNLLAESKEMITIFPCGLQRLHELCRFTDSSSSDSELCLSCKTPASKLCGNCKAVSYCSKECQVRHWRTEHKHECSIIKQLREWSQMDWEHYDYPRIPVAAGSALRRV